MSCIRKFGVLVLVAVLSSAGAVGCKSGRKTGPADHPTAEHPKGEHPKGEHPKH